MRILATNDDGQYAQGLWTMVKALKALGEVVVVAPDREQSAVGTSVTLHHPLRAREVPPLVEGVTSFSVEGTPADCVILALGHLIDGDVDIVVSGINEGPNLGDDVLISGTVGAALQGYLRGLPSVAVSVGALEGCHFDVAAHLAAIVVARIAQGSLPRRILLNINLPNQPLECIQGLEVTQLGQRRYVDTIAEGHDGKREYYWIVRGTPEWMLNEGTDIWALSHDRISITPLHAVTTNPRVLSKLTALSPAMFRELSHQG
ncbi:MAG: 5'/3'-nucleotidase SurE [Chloroflexota bacterium]|nr:5'/3'-nucleotidase SurE [Chloroflexota bacterium]